MMVEIISKAKDELMNSRPMVGIDIVLEAFSDVKQGKISVQTSELFKVFSQAVLLKIKGTDKDFLSEDDQISDLLFDQILSHQQLYFVAICLLRLLCANDESFKNVQFRIKAFNLFDKVLSNNIYKLLKVEENDQTYQKESKLKDVVPKVEFDLHLSISSINSLDVLPQFRQHFMGTINSSLSKAILWPFFPRELLQTRLDEIFNSVEEYWKTKGPEMLQTFQKASEIIKNYLSDVEQYGTYYSRSYLGGVARKLGDLLEKHFAESDVSKPALVVVKKSEKKYPFHARDKDINLSFIVQNVGPGYAFDVDLKLLTTDNVVIKRPELYLGHLEPTSIVVEFPARVETPEEIALGEIEISWTNFDKSRANKLIEFEIEGQRTDLDWENLAKEEPYSLEPVETEADLVDRKEVLEQLIAKVQAKNVGSSYIFGQKRVGKTSVVKTLETHLIDLNPSDYLVIYLESGDYVRPNSTTTIKDLGTRICEAIKEADKRFENLEIPDLTDALSPLTKFLDSVVKIVPTYRILFILDEFDELPIELYKPGSVGNAFFLTLRSISGKPPFGFILVGGEMMEYIMSFQGIRLNKFKSIRLDYFDREKHWSDFQELVRRPVAKWFEISDDALVALYKQTSGNPFFTKLICGRLFELMVERRDCHVTRAEIEEATKLALQQDVETNKIQHFWTDGIFDPDNRFEEVSMRRRKVLLCLSEAFRQYGIARKEDILERGVKVYGMDVSSLENDLREFERRQVFIAKNNCCDCKVPFFREWLKERGVREIITTFSDPDAILQRKKQEEEVYIQSKEIVELANKWGLYKGRRLTEDYVRSWLGQFGDNTNQRLMFRILQGLSFYTSDCIRTKMKEAYGIVVRGLTRKLETGKRKMANILISYIDSPGKSGSQYAKRFADENNIYYTNVVERSRIKEELEKRRDLQVLVFIDDFIGSGVTVRKGFHELDEDCGGFLRDCELRIFFIAICGFEECQTKIEEVITERNLPISVHICDPIDESAKCFGDSSRIFPDLKERERAKYIAYQHGVQLVKNAPLGFGDCQATVVFEHSCPNNTLPILWAESKDWKPLFKS